MQIEIQVSLTKEDFKDEKNIMLYSEDLDADIDVDVSANLSPVVPARTYGPPEDCYPEEGGDCDDLVIEILTWDAARLAEAEAVEKSLAACQDSRERKALRSKLNGLKYDDLTKCLTRKCLDNIETELHEACVEAMDDDGPDPDTRDR